MAQSWRVTTERPKKPRPPLDAEALQRLALHYVGRYATSRAKLKSYLARKLKERGWDGEGAAPVDSLVERMASLGYVDDAAFAIAQAGSLQRRGYGARRVGQALRAAGIADEDSAEAREQVQDGAMAAALRFARRKRIGPYAESNIDHGVRQKAFGAMMRAGHSPEVARVILNLSSDDIPDCDIA